MGLPTDKKREIVLLALSKKVSVSKIAKVNNISRKVIYSWIKRYRSKKLIPLYKKGRVHPREYCHTFENRVIRIVKKNPHLSISGISKQLKVGRHAVYNLLSALKLTTEDSRLAFCNLYSFPGVLSPEIKVSVVRSIINKEISVTKAAKENRIARKTLYKWIREYKNNGNISNSYVAGFDHPKSFDKNTEEFILAQVVKNPELSIHSLSKMINYSVHGVFNVLKRYGLTYKDARLAYAQAHAGDLDIAKAPSGIWQSIKNSFTNFITPNLAPAPPPETHSSWGSTLKVFSVSLFLTLSVSLLSIWWVSAVISAPNFVTGVGMVFAIAALGFGMFFFLYSLKYYISLAIVLSHSQNEGLVDDNKKESNAIGLKADLDDIKLKKHPFVSVHVALYNEKHVVERLAKAVTSFDYPTYEVILADDSTDETSDKIREFQKGLLFKNESLKITKGEGWTLSEVEVKPGVILKHLHRTTRTGYKGAALALALKLTDKRAEYVSIFDADFVPYTDSINLFLKYFQIKNDARTAAVQGYQWHVLNKSENWITRGVRSEYSGSYVIERAGTEIYSGLKQISGSVYMIKKSVLEEVGWGTSITEDFELTLKLYQKGYKVVYTPYIQAPAECVSTLRRLVRQRMRWAEGHSFNIKKMLLSLLKSPKLTFSEKFEAVYLAPYYLQAMFFLAGTMAWLISETVFRVRLPLWTEIWGWSLVLTNMISLPLLNSVGLFLEESEQKDYSGIPSFIALSYIVVPFQAYAAVKGFLEKAEGPWFRTPKTGKVTDIFTRNKFYRFIQEIIPGGNGVVNSSSSSFSPYLSLATANNRFNKFDITSRSGRRWIGKLGLTFTLLFSMTLTSMAPFIPSIASVGIVQASDNFSVLPGSEEKDFSKGVLAVNSNKKDYVIGETAYIQMASLDDKGHTLCDSDLNLEIKYPGGKTVNFRTGGGGINNSTECGDDNVTSKPDYYSMFKTDVVGSYLLTLTNLESNNQITNTFTVENNLNISTERVSATRINPFKSDYEMKIKFKAYKEINQVVTDKLPEGFTVTELGDGKMSLGQNSVSMHVNLKSGEEKEFFYKYQAPEVSPEFYIINGWQIASDVTRLYVSNAAADKTLPSVQGTWSDSSNSLTKTLGAKSGSAATQTFTNTTTNTNNLIGRWQSLPLSSDTSFSTSNTVQYVIGAKTSSTTNTTMHFRVHVFVIESDGSTVRGTLLNNYTGTGTAFSTTATGRTDSTQALSNNVSAKAGDRIVVEIGCARTGTDNSSSRTCTFNYGNTGTTDLTSGNTSVTSRPGWVEFSNDFTTAAGAAPTVTTQAVSDITSTAATGNGTVTLDNGFPITERGVVWNTAGTPTTSDSKATSSGTTGSYTASITGLSSAITYYVRAYAINSQGTSYGGEVNFDSASVNKTQYSFQRKTWYDGTRFWKTYIYGSQIQFWYSTDGTNWTQNTSATISIAAGDFSIEADSSNAYIVYTTSNDIKGRKASSYPGTGFSWGSESTVFNGSSATNDYSYAVITQDSSNYIWVGARYTGSGVYYYKTIKASATSTIPVDTSDTAYTVSDRGNTNSNVFGNLVPRTSQNMYTVVAVGTSLYGCGWSNASSTWLDSSGSACGGGNWYNGNWSYRIKLTIDSSKVDADLTDFPIYVSLANLPSGFHSHVNQTDGRDIRVTKGDGITELPREVVFYTAASDTGELHFKYSGTLSGSTNTDVYIYYGNSGASDYAVDATYGAQNVWNSGYQGVWHLNETSSGTGAVTRYDSTSNNNDLTDVNTTASGGGKMGNGSDHVRANQEYLTITDANQHNLDVTTALTISYWYSGDTEGSQSNVSKGTWNTAYQYETGCSWSNPCRGSYYTSDGWTDAGVAGTSAYPWNGTWASIVWVHDGGDDEDRLFYGGVLEGTVTGVTNDLSDNPGDFSIGTGENPYYVDGIMDEVRMSNVVRESTWISSEYNNQNSPSTFYSVGSEESKPSLTSLATLTSGTSNNISMVSDSSGNVHLIYIDSSGNVVYKEYTSAWQSAVTLDSNSGNTSVSITIDTTNSSLYSFWIRSNHIYYKVGASPYASDNWDASATDWKNGTNLKDLTSNYSGSAKMFVEWTSDAAEPYTVNWDQIVVPEFAWLFMPIAPFIPLLAKFKKKKYAEKRII